MFQMQTGSIVRFASAYGFTLSYTASRVTRFLLYAQCVENEPLTHAAIYDNSSCTAGCPVRFISAGFRIYGTVRVESVQQRPSKSLTSGLWNRCVLLEGGDAGHTRAPQDVARLWKEHSVITSTVLPGQKIEIQARRHISVEEVATIEGKDTPQRLALDVVAVVPVLSQDVVKVVQGNTSFIMTIVYVPSSNDLRTIAMSSPRASASASRSWTARATTDGLCCADGRYTA
jgi:hypothetical protein